MKVGKFGVEGADKNAITTERPLQSSHLEGYFSGGVLLLLRSSTIVYLEAKSLILLQT